MRTKELVDVSTGPLLTQNIDVSESQPKERAEIHQNNAFVDVVALFKMKKLTKRRPRSGTRWMLR